MKCRLTSGKQPTVQFLWFHNGYKIGRGPNFKIKSRNSGSVLNIRGLPETAGIHLFNFIGITLTLVSN